MGRALLLLLVAAALAAGLVLSQNVSWRSRRAPSGFLTTFDLAPMVDGALPPGVPAALKSDQNSVRFWRREYRERSFHVRAGLDSAQAAAFLVAVRDSIERRLELAKATVRGVSATAWPGDSAAATWSDPIALTIPYATRRRAGWVTLRAHRSTVGEVVLWVLVHEGPRPSD